MINIINFDDWIAIYINDNLEFEGHSIKAEELLDILKIKYKSKWIELDEIDTDNFLPKKYKDLNLE